MWEVSATRVARRAGTTQPKIAGATRMPPEAWVQGVLEAPTSTAAIVPPV
jgi:hypothetical protein